MVPWPHIHLVHAYPVPARHLHDWLIVRNIERRIPQILQIYRFRASIHQCLEILHAVALGKAHFDTEIPERNLEHRKSPAIEERYSHYIVPRAAYIGHRQEDGRLSGSRSDSRNPVLKGRHPLLEHLVGRIRYAGIDISRTFQLEKFGPVLHVVKSICRTLINGHGRPFRHRVNLLPGPYLQCLESVFCHKSVLFFRYISIPSGIRVRHILPSLSISSSSGAMTAVSCGYSSRKPS